ARPVPARPPAWGGRAPPPPVPHDHAAAPAVPAAAPVSRVEFVGAAPAADAATWIKDETATLRARGRAPLVYVGASWCGPCRAFHEAATAGKLDAALPHVTFLEVDADRDAERLVMAGLSSAPLPPPPPAAHPPRAPPRPR